MDHFIAMIWKLVKAILNFFVFKLFHLPISPENWEKFLQFVKFGMIGVTNSILYYILYLISLMVFARLQIFHNTDYLVAQFVGFAISVLWSFYWNRRYVFHAEPGQESWPRALLKSYISYGFTGIILNSILAILWVQFFHIPKEIAPIFNLIVSVPLNFFLNKFWAFRKRAEK